MSIIVGEFEVDVALVEEPVFDSEITDKPVEVGANITDHQRLLPTDLMVEGFVSDSPTGSIVDRRSQGSVPSVDAYAYFKTLRESKEPFTVQTTKDIFDNMLVRTLSPISTTQDGFRFRCTFKQVVFVTNERTTIPVSTPGGAKKVKRGSRPVKAGPTVRQVATQRGYTSLQEMFDDEDKFYKQTGQYPKIDQLHKSPPVDIFIP
jgi:hypothetical protein